MKLGWVYMVLRRMEKYARAQPAYSNEVHRIDIGVELTYRYHLLQCGEDQGSKDELVLHETGRERADDALEKLFV